MFASGQQTLGCAAFALSSKGVYRVGAHWHYTDATVVQYPFQSISWAEMEVVPYRSGYNGLSSCSDGALHCEPLNVNYQLC